MKSMPQHACDSCNELVETIRGLKHEFQRVKRLPASELAAELNLLQASFGALEGGGGVSTELKPMPLVSSVQLLRYDAQGQPRPVATIHIDAADKIAFTGDAGRAYAPLLNATRRCGVRLANQSLNEALSESRTLRDDPPDLPAVAAGDAF